MLVEAPYHAIVMKSTMLVAGDVWPDIVGKKSKSTNRLPQSVYSDKEFLCKRKGKAPTGEKDSSPA